MGTCSCRMAVAHTILRKITEKYFSDENKENRDIDDWLKIDQSCSGVRGVLDVAVEDACRELGLKYEDMTELKIAVASLAVLAEVADVFKKSGEHRRPSLELFIKQMDNIDTDLDQLCSAHGLLEQAENYLRIGNITRAMELLDKMSTRANDALNCSAISKTDDLVMATKLLILDDIIYNSLTTRDSGLEIVPTRNLQEEKRLEIITLVTGHVRRFVKQMKKKSENFDGLSRVISLWYLKEDYFFESRHAEKTLQRCQRWVEPKTVFLTDDERTIQVTIPPLKLIPKGAYDRYYGTRRLPELLTLSVPQPSLSRRRSIPVGYKDLILWTEERWGKGPDNTEQHFLNLGYLGVIYTVLIIDNDDKIVNEDEELKVTIKDQVITEPVLSPSKPYITEVSGKEVDVLRDLTSQMEVEPDLEKSLDKYYPGYWTGRDIKIVLAGVRTGDITCLNLMPLCQADIWEQEYSKESYYEALEIIPFTRSLYFCTGEMSVVMGLAEWQELTERVVVGLDHLVLAVVSKQSGWYKSTYHSIEGGCEGKVALLVPRVKLAVIDCLIMSNFDLFIDAVWEGLGVNPGVAGLSNLYGPGIRTTDT